MSTTWFKGESRQESSGVDELLQEDRQSAEVPKCPVVQQSGSHLSF